MNFAYHTLINSMKDKEDHDFFRPDDASSFHEDHCDISIIKNTYSTTVHIANHIFLPFLQLKFLSDLDESYLDPNFNHVRK